MKKLLAAALIASVLAAPALADTTFGFVNTSQGVFSVTNEAVTYNSFAAGWTLPTFSGSVTLPTGQTPTITFIPTFDGSVVGAAVGTNGVTFTLSNMGQITCSAAGTCNSNAGASAQSTVTSVGAGSATFTITNTSTAQAVPPVVAPN